MKDTTIDSEAKRLEGIIKDQIEAGWNGWSPLIRDRMVEQIIENNCGTDWETMLINRCGSYPSVRIVRYQGPITITK